MTGRPSSVRDFYEARAASVKGAKLNLVAHRIGKLAPAPGGIAITTIPTFASLSALSAGDSPRNSPVEVMAAGTYADVGREIL